MVTSESGRDTEMPFYATIEQRRRHVNGRCGESRSRERFTKPRRVQIVDDHIPISNGGECPERRVIVRGQLDPERRWRAPGSRKKRGGCGAQKSSPIHTSSPCK